MIEIDQQDARTQALRAVIDRVTSWQESATEGTIHDELDRGLSEAGVTLTDEQRDELAQRISDSEEIDVEALAAEG